MDPRVLGALIGGGFALAGVLLTLFMQGRRENRHRFTVHRQKSYAKYYLLSNKVGGAHLELDLGALRAVLAKVGQEGSTPAQPSEEMQRKVLAFSAFVEKQQRDLERMHELHASFAIMCPYPLRKAARDVLNACIALHTSLMEPEKLRRAEASLVNSQVMFVNLARKDLGVTPWWKPTVKADSWLGQLQAVQLVERDAAETRASSGRTA